MVGRRTFLSSSLILGFLLRPWKSVAQQSKVFLIGFLGVIPYLKAYEELWRHALEKVGYVDGQNASFVVKYGPIQELRALAYDFVRMNVDVITCAGSAAVRAAMDATRTIPLVTVELETDPIARGFASSLAHPGGNLTGYFLNFPEFSGKRLEILKETLPTLTRVAVLWDPSMEQGPLTGLEGAAQRYHLRVSIQEVQDEATLEDAMRNAHEQKAGAILVMQSPKLDAYRSQILTLAAQYRLPLMGMFAIFAAQGALLSYGPNVEDLVSRTAMYIDRILKGEKPGDLPIQRPSKFDFVVNMKTAKDLGLKLPQSVVERADQLIR